MKKLILTFGLYLLIPVFIIAQNKKEVITSLNQTIDSLLKINAYLQYEADSLKSVIQVKDNSIASISNKFSKIEKPKIANDTVQTSSLLYNKSTKSTTKTKGIKKNIELLKLLNDSLANLSMVTDYDGNVYSTVSIGKQVWMKENLKSTHYSDGSSIKYITENSKWSSATSGAYCNYNNYASNAIYYGRLYNWYAISDSRNICPNGWHVPSELDWKTLTEYLGGEGIAGGKLKSDDTTFWKNPNAYATNESGFTGLATGTRKADGTFDNVKKYGYWWALTPETSASAWYRNLSYNMATVNSYNAFVKNDKKSGYCVRCMKD
jgi:uncharacterized protein (TIGR02145 family)